MNLNHEASTYSFLPCVLQTVSSASREDFYRLLAGLTDEFISLDHDYVKMLVSSSVGRGH